MAKFQNFRLNLAVFVHVHSQKKSETHQQEASATREKKAVKNLKVCFLEFFIPANSSQKTNGKIKKHPNPNLGL